MGYIQGSRLMDYDNKPISLRSELESDEKEIARGIVKHQIYRK